MMMKGSFYSTAIYSCEYASNAFPVFATQNTDFLYRRYHNLLKIYQKHFSCCEY